ncbi:hypothetical protein NMG60_11030416 [Bertholletia excelsa]
MGKATRWFRSLLGLKKESPAQAPAVAKPPKRRWSFVKSHREKYAAGERGCHGVPAPRDADDDSSRHAIAVAAATAAVAEAAVAAAQAAAEVVRLTSSGRSSAPPGGVCGGGGVVREEYWAAIKIQSHFRAYLARRALRALKGLVKLQALVRGHIVRKQTADMLRRMQALLRAQARARAERIQIVECPYSTIKSSQFLHPAPATPEKFEHAIRSKVARHDQSLMLKRTGSKSTGHVIIDEAKAQNGRNWIDCQMDERSREQRRPAIKPSHLDDEKSDKILEVDTVKPYFTRKLGKNPFQSACQTLASDHSSHRFSTSKDTTTHLTAPTPSSSEVQSLSPLKFAKDEESESPFCTADNSPQFYSASSRGGSSWRGPFTPTRSDGSRSCLSGYSDHPNFMACTESSRAKIRSLSAPKQRPQFERSFSTKRYSVHGYADSRSSTQRVFASKAYPGSGRLDRLGVSLRGDPAGLLGGNWNRH